jgi:hypothetical protein
MSPYELRDGAGMSDIFDFSLNKIVVALAIRCMTTKQRITVVDFGDNMVVQFKVLTPARWKMNIVSCDHISVITPKAAPTPSDALLTVAACLFHLRTYH